ncbi:MAG TPA: membrane protein insertase YidC [Chlamydiales bacterium]|jgi:YidC/Oxa1 family membrane protein insertase
MDKRSLLFLACVSASFLAIQMFFGQGAAPAPKEIVKKELPAKKLTVSNKTIAQADVSRDVGDQNFYVLENEFQQLVFSTKGGALAEVNLPLKSAAHPNSIVKEIQVDRKILAESPQNAQFPLRPFSIASKDGTISQKTGVKGGYYPLLRRPILNKEGVAKSAVPAQFYALNVLDEDAASATFRVTKFTDQSIRFEGTVDGRSVTKTYSIANEAGAPYCIDLEIQVDGEGNPLWLTSGVPDAELVGGAYTPQLKVQVTRKGSSEVDELSLPKSVSDVDTAINPNWISNCNGFLGFIIDPLSPMIADGYQTQKIDGTELPTRLSLIDSAYQLYKPVDYPGYATLLPLQNGTTKLRVFAGPFDESLLKGLDEKFEDPAQNYNPEYRLAISIQGWFSFISQPFSKFLFFLMQIFFAITRSWAASIILLTIALRAMMYPLNNWSIKSTIKMQEIAPRVKAVQERNKKDPRKGQMEVMQLYKEAGVNPFSGCIPMLLQMPFLIGMFYMLKSSFPLRGAVFIPGWINDLAAPDVVFSWGQPFWLIGNQLHLLPNLMGIVMFIQGKMTQKTPKDPSQLTDQEKQQKMMGTMMSVLFTVMFYNFPSGLNLYFMFSTLLGILQQKWMTQKLMANRPK